MVLSCDCRRISGALRQGICSITSFLGSSRPMSTTNKVFVGGIPPWIKQPVLREAFSGFGDVSEVTLMREVEGWNAKIAAHGVVGRFEELLAWALRESSEHPVGTHCSIPTQTSRMNQLFPIELGYESPRVCAGARERRMARFRILTALQESGRSNSGPSLRA